MKKENKLSPRLVPLPGTLTLVHDCSLPTPWTPKPHQVPLPTTPNPRRKKKLGKITSISSRSAITSIDPYLVPLPPSPEVSKVKSLSPTQVNEVKLNSTPLFKGRKMKPTTILDTRATTLGESHRSQLKPNLVQRLDQFLTVRENAQ